MRWFGEPHLDKYKDPWAKGERLADLVREQPTLLILDGLEPLQHPPGPLLGEFSDPALQALLRGLGECDVGLCVVTTRVAVPTLIEMSKPRCVSIDLDTLTEADGGELLRLYGVFGSDADLQQASRDYGGHSLALILLGTYLRDRFGGDIMCRNRVVWPTGFDESPMLALSSDDLGKAAPDFSRHARKVMASYVNWFENEPDSVELTAEDRKVSRAALSILHLMGLFNRPADAGCLNALRTEPPIPGLTEPLFASKDREELWERAVIRLREADLLTNADSQVRSLDAHPLIREYFSEQLMKASDLSFKEAHRRLYEHLKQSAPEFPDNLNDMMPLYLAVEHGCQAGLTEAVWEEVWWQRIQRNSRQFSVKQLGAFSSDLKALRSFFERPWDRPSPEFSEYQQGFALELAAYRLRGMGFVRQATDVQSSALDLKRGKNKPNDLRLSAKRAFHLASMYLSLGLTGKGIQLAQVSLDLADWAYDAYCQTGKLKGTTSTNRATFQLIQSRLEVGNSLADAGEFEMAEIAYKDAESLQAIREPNLPFLYIVWGFRFHRFLLDSLHERCDKEVGHHTANAFEYKELRAAWLQCETKRIQSLIERAVKVYEIQTEHSHVSQGLDYVLLGKAKLMNVANSIRDSSAGATLSVDGGEKV